MPLIIAEWLLEGLTWLVVASAILSWFPAARGHAATRLIQSIVNPLLTPFRAILPRMGGIDFSPLLTIVMLTILKVLLRPVY
jgi:YggT family protein